MMLIPKYLGKESVNKLSFYPINLAKIFEFYIKVFALKNPHHAGEKFCK